MHYKLIREYTVTSENCKQQHIIHVHAKILKGTRESTKTDVINKCT